MATARVTYLGSQRTENTHLKSGTVIETDAPVDNKGKGMRFSPTDLVATALCDCMLTIMGIAAQEQGFSIDGATAEVEKVMSDSPPRRIAKVIIRVDLTMCTLTEKQRRLLNAVPPLCPVSLSLHPSIVQDVQLKFE
ncbi:MAG TPA: OsmC family protein [Bacteroidales bacterium]|nr:OsmC family protein [Bacteroidales bacterium]